MESELVFRSVGGDIELFGLLPNLHRLPDDLIGRVNEGTTALARCPAGGRLRFRTDSKRISLRVSLEGESFSHHMPLTGAAGCDVLENGWFLGGTCPMAKDATSYEATFVRRVEGFSDLLIHLPTYAAVASLEVGLDEGARVMKCAPYRYAVPVAFYGSSITQGGCASRPANTYEAVLSRYLDFDFINLGFSGSAKGELVMAEYIASLGLSALVMDYDHNAPSVEHLQNTHEPFFRAVRAKKPDLPILMLTMPDRDRCPAESKARRDVIFATYARAAAAGDGNVWFIDGRELFGETDRADCTVDGCHPNDLGFNRMASRIRPVLREMLERA